ncbi:MAG: hypothetical protein QHH75_10335 [Bacillota bacterium]|nr:hypothetical protein [Bacillota bacterium]
MEEDAKVNFLRPSVKELIADLAVAVFFLLMGAAGCYFVDWLLLRHPLKITEYVAALLHPYTLPGKIFDRVLCGYFISITGWIIGVKYLSDLSVHVSGRARGILDAFIMLSFFAPVLVALIFRPFGFHPFSFNFKAFGGGLLFTCYYFILAAMFLR